MIPIKCFQIYQKSSKSFEDKCILVRCCLGEAANFNRICRAASLGSASCKYRVYERIT